MRLSAIAPPAVEALLFGLTRSLNADDPRRAASLDSAQQWFASVLTTGIASSSPSSAAPGADAEEVADAAVRRRLERYVEEILPAAKREGAGRSVTLHVRPLRSRLHAALTLLDGRDALIVVDDVVHDLTVSVARWITASCFASQTSPTRTDSPLVPLFDAVRIVRAELGTVRWNGALWQPVEVRLPDDWRGFAAVIGELAVKFVLAHEIGHVALGHLEGGARDGAEAELRRCEHEADAFAARVVRAHVRDTVDDAVEADSLARAAMSIALGTLDAVTAAFLVRGDGRPQAGERFASACRSPDLGSASSPFERSVANFFEHLDGLVLAATPPLADLVERSDAISFARPYDIAERRELDRVDRIEGLFHTPIPALLDALGDLALPAGDPPREVVDAARHADQMNTGDDTRPLPPAAWIRCAAGRWWLFSRLLAARDVAEIEATLEPRAGTRFRDWARWVERDCPEQWRGTVLAALHVYVTVGPRADGDALRRSGLIDAVDRWLSGVWSD